MNRMVLLKSQKNYLDRIFQKLQFFDQIYLGTRLLFQPKYNLR